MSDTGKPVPLHLARAHEHLAARRDAQLEAHRLVAEHLAASTPPPTTKQPASESTE